MSPAAAARCARGTSSPPSENIHQITGTWIEVQGWIWGTWCMGQLNDPSVQNSMGQFEMRVALPKNCLSKEKTNCESCTVGFRIIARDTIFKTSFKPNYPKANQVYTTTKWAEHNTIIISRLSSHGTHTLIRHGYIIHIIMGIDMAHNSTLITCTLSSYNSHSRVQLWTYTCTKYIQVNLLEHSTWK